MYGLLGNDIWPRYSYLKIYILILRKSNLNLSKRNLTELVMFLAQVWLSLKIHVCMH
uniref:Uncharacterized protein n=1 Tax=Cyprinus carpio TaxID=7962 RepID=A0A8C1Y3J3_CYPCA